MPATKKRTRRTPEQMIQDLQREIERVKRKAAEQKVKKDPALKHINAAVRSIDKAAGETEDGTTKQALVDARTTLVACLELSGAPRPRASRNGRVTPAGPSPEPKDVLAYLKKHPGSRGEDVASALGIDTKGLRPVMRELVDDGQVKTKGKARGMRYTAA